MPELPKRMGSDVTPLAEFLQNLAAATARYLKPLKSQHPAVTTVTVGFAPGGRLRVWLEGWDAVLSAKQQSELTTELESLVPIQVANGPVALNVTLELFGATAGKVDPSKMPLPEEWKTAIAPQKNPVAVPDGLPDSIWNKPAQAAPTAP